MVRGEEYIALEFFFISLGADFCGKKKKDIFPQIFFTPQKIHKNRVQII